MGGGLKKTVTAPAKKIVTPEKKGADDNEEMPADKDPVIALNSKNEADTADAS